MRVALVLSGGAAHGAWEVGVARYLFDDLARELGRPPPIEILCGTSVGAINASVLAAYADEGAGRIERLARRWCDLRIEQVLRPQAWVIGARGGLLDPRPFERMVREIPFARIGDHLRAGRLAALAVSATEVASGRTVVFVDGTPPPARDHDAIELRAAEITAEHVLASSAIPLLLHAVSIDGQLYCDGGLRQNVPLLPALRLGAEGLVVVNPHPVETVDRERARARQRSVGGPLFLAGKTLNALLIDRLDGDLDRLNQVNDILGAGVRRYGARFLGEINHDLGLVGPRALRPVPTVAIRPSQDLGTLGGAYVRSRAFPGGGAAGRLLRLLADGERGDADLLSYLLFDGGFARRLIDLGRADARASHDALRALFAASAPGERRSPGRANGRRRAG